MGAKSLFALDNLWDGLGALTVIKPNVRYFFGKFTMYPSYIRRGRDMILYFLHKHFADKENLIVPMKPLEIEADPKELATVGECLYEPLANDETLRHSHQLWLRRRGGNRHTHRY